MCTYKNNSLYLLLLLLLFLWYLGHHIFCYSTHTFFLAPQRSYNCDVRNHSQYYQGSTCKIGILLISYISGTRIDVCAYELSLSVCWQWLNSWGLSVSSGAKKLYEINSWPVRPLPSWPYNLDNSLVFACFHICLPHSLWSTAAGSMVPILALDNSYFEKYRGWSQYKITKFHIHLSTKTLA